MYSSIQKSLDTVATIDSHCVHLSVVKKKKENKENHNLVSNYILATHAFNLPSQSKLFHSILGCTYNQL